MNPKIIIAVIIVAAIAGGSFYAGDAYAKSQRGTRGQFGAGNAQFMRGQNGDGGPSGMRGGITAGEILSKDASGITVKMPDGSTRIVLVGADARITKSATGTPEDLKPGEQVAITGSANQDGSVTAETVQLRPAGVMFREGPEGR